MNRLRRLLHDLTAMAQSALAGVNRRLGGLPLLLKRTLDSYNAHDGPFVSAAMAYYFFLTLFPLTLALIALGSLFLETEQAKEQAVRFIARAVPALEAVIANNIDLVLEQRGPIGILAALSFVYSASGLFGVLLTVVNRAWDSYARQSSLMRRVLAILLVIGLALFFYLSITLTTAFEALRQMTSQVLGVGAQEVATAYAVISQLISFLVAAGLFLILYWKLPAARVRLADVLPAAVTAGVAWEAARRLFGWYLSRFARFTLVYGSLAAIIGLLTWLYLTGYIIQLGAELSSQIAARRGRGIDS